MADIQGVKQALAQAQVERLQEGARRLGDQQQQGFALSLNRQVDEREHRVNEGEKAREEAIDPNARRQREQTPRRGQPEEEPPDAAREEDGDGEERGRHVDARA